MMNIRIRIARKEDCSGILGLIKELAVFERAPDQVVLSEQDLQRDGFSKTPLFKCFVATVDDSIVGIALFYPRYSTWKGSTLHLEDLIVSKKFTGKGIGSGLYKEFIRYAYQQGVQRVEWAVLDWNSNAIDFYKRSGAQVFDDWRIVQMTREQMEEYLSAG